MLLRRNILYLFLYLFISILTAFGASDILLNGTNIYLATGDFHELYQGYILSLKGVSSDGSVWLQLAENDTIVKSDIVHNHGSFVYNRTNKTILSVKVGEVYSGSSEQKLVSFFLYQFIDPDLPAPYKTTTPDNTINPRNNKSSPGLKPPQEPVIWILGIGLIIILFYILRRLW